MQLFILHKMPRISAQMYCDKHVVKILTEACQILCTVYRANIEGETPDFMYLSTHYNHPCTKWTGKNLSNFKYTLKLAEELYKEYQFRYNKPDKHTRAKQIINYLKEHLPQLKNEPQTEFIKAIDKEKHPDLHDKHLSAVQAYRLYYERDKKHLFKWTKREKPYWIKL